MKCYRKILSTIDCTIKKNSLLCDKDRVLVALSGGSDSVLLLHFLKKLSEKYHFTLSAAHLNHSLRKEADFEEKFVIDLCNKIGVEVFTKKSDISEISKKEGISTETAGRNERYLFFDELKSKYNFTKIATAHHLNDNAETILMHFIRGCGTGGIRGIDYIRDNTIIRPLLDITKKDILACCHEENWEYVTDNSNFEDVYTRNKLRLNLIPSIEEFNPNFSSVITANAELFKDDDDFLNYYADKIFKEEYNDGIKKSVLENEFKAISRRLVQMLYKKSTGSNQNLSQKYIDAILSLSTSGQSVSLPSGFVATLQYGILSILPYEEKKLSFQYEIKLDERVYIPEVCEYWTVKKATKPVKNTFSLPKNSRLIIRSRENGDIFFPIGMTGRKSVSNLFTDKKIPPAKRDIIPILTADNEIVTIGGKFFDRRFYKQGTDNLFYLEIITEN